MDTYLNTWKQATLIRTVSAAAHISSLRFSLDDWTPHIPGQYYGVRVPRKAGGYAIRSYSAASAPHEKGIIELGVALFPQGEVSPHLAAMRLGENVEMQGPFGAHFRWEHAPNTPLVMVGGGSGMAPLLSMLRHEA